MAGVITRPPRHRSDAAPPAEPPEHGGGGGGWALLTVAKNVMLAYLIQGRLAQQGIETMLDATNLSPGAWLHPFGDPSSPVRVFVHRVDLTAASMTLHDVELPNQDTGSGGLGPPGRAATGPGRLREFGWLRLVVGAMVALLAAAALSGLVMLGPCVSHWFCT